MPKTLNGYYTEGELAGRRVDSVPDANPNRPWQEGAASGTPTIGSIYGSVSGNDRFIDSSTSYYKGIAETPVDEAKVREDVMRRLQAEIDATNSIYAQKLSNVQRQGQARLGSDAAIQSRRGLLGSDFGAGQTGQVTDLNNQVEDGVRAEQAAAIAALQNKGALEIKSELEAKNAARAEGADKYISFLNESEKRRGSRTSTAAQLALQSGIDLRTLDKSQIKALADSYQVSVDALLTTYGQLADAQAAAEAEAQAAKAKAALDADKIRSGIAVDQSTIAKNGRIELSEGAAIYDASGNRIAYNPKVFAPKDGGGDVTPLAGTTPFIGQNNYARLTAGQKKQADSLNNLVREMTLYRAELDKMGNSGINLTGEDAALLQTKLNSIVFAAAQAEGTGALQAADRAVIEKITPNPTSLGGAWDAITKGGKKGQLAQIDDQIRKYTQNLAGYGLTPVFEEATAPAAQSERIRVRLSDGNTGTIDASEFDPATMTRL